MAAKFVPATDLVQGMELLSLPEGYIPLDACVFLKCIDPDGAVAWLNRYTKDLGLMETLGACRAATLLNERDVLNAYEPTQEGDDDASS